MKKFLSILTISLVSAIAVSACDKEPENLMSPCVSAKNGVIADPCDRYPINNNIKNAVSAHQLSSYEFKA